MAGNQLTDAIYDNYASLRYKLGAGVERSDLMQPTWFPKSERRRIQNYHVLDGLVKNYAAEFETNEERAATLHEFGEPGLVRDRYVAGIIGDEFRLIVEGGDTPPPDAPLLPEHPGDVPGDATEIETQIHAARLTRWEADAARVFEQWQAEWDAWPIREAWQQYLDRWSREESVRAKIFETESNHAVPLGDGVQTMGWSARTSRPKYSVRSPYEYFPLVDVTNDFPDVVHLAFEERSADDTEPAKLHRETWRIGPVLPAIEDGQMLYRNGDTYPVPSQVGPGTVLPHHRDPDLVPVTVEGDEYRVHRNGTEGAIFRPYPWNPDGSPYATYNSYGVWAIDGTKPREWDDLDDASAVWQVNEEGDQLRDFDLGIDYVPVIHVPCFPDTENHFGHSPLSGFAQVFDAMDDQNSDIRAASALAALPMIGNKKPAETTLGVPSSDGTETVVEPGGVINGDFTVLNTAVSLEPLLAVKHDLWDQLATVSQIGRAGLGLQSANNVAGITLRLSFTAYVQMVENLRLTREKYRLVAKFAMRQAQAAAARALRLDGPDAALKILPEILWEGVTPQVEARFGQFVPTDVEKLVEQVAALRNADAMSAEAGISKLAEIGFDVADPEEEIARIKALDSSGAADVAVLGPRYMADWLGVEFDGAGPGEPDLGVPTLPDLNLDGLPPPPEPDEA